MAKAKKKATKREKPVNDTTTTHWISFRWPHGLVEQLDELVIAERKRTGFPTLNRTQVLVKIVRDAVEKK